MVGPTKDLSRPIPTAGKLRELSCFCKPAIASPFKRNCSTISPKQCRRLFSLRIFRVIDFQRIAVPPTCPQLRPCHFAQAVVVALELQPSAKVEVSFFLKLVAGSCVDRVSACGSCSQTMRPGRFLGLTPLVDLVTRIGHEEYAGIACIVECDVAVAPVAILNSGDEIRIWINIRTYPRLAIRPTLPGSRCRILHTPKARSRRRRWNYAQFRCDRRRWEQKHQSDHHRRRETRN